MALFRPTLGELSGSVGNATFSHSKSGATLRRRSVPTQPLGANAGFLRTYQRIALAKVSVAWAALTDNQKQEWRDWAIENQNTNALGERHALSGHQAFVALNSRRGRLNLAAVATPPIALAPAGIIPSAASITAATTLRVTLSPVTVPAGVKLTVWQTLPNNGGVRPRRRDARLCVTISGGTVTPANAALLHPIQTGQHCTFFIEVWNPTDGQASQAARLDLVR